MTKHIVILGSTGSIGTQTLDVVRRLPERLSVVGLSGFRNIELLRAQAAEFGVSPDNIEHGDAADLTRLATLPSADLVVVSVAGAVGTRATIAALEAGKDVALATKEVLVAAGEIVTETARRSGARILPIDSEHSAIFQCLQGEDPDRVAKLWLTASGGPFRDWPAERIEGATLADALCHPTWPSMGRKITVDSATLMNKGLEMIEARWLFDVPIEKVDVTIHPQSVVHSMVAYCDGSTIAQLGHPDMRTPIAYALLYPTRVDAGLPQFDPTAMNTALTFAPPDHARFPSLTLARTAAQIGGTAPAALNAANEAAVALFLGEQIRFTAIAEIVTRVLESHTPLPHPTLEQIAETDRTARLAVHQIASADRSLQLKGAVC